MPLSIWPPYRARSAPLPYASAHTLPPVRRSEFSSPTQPAPGMGRSRAQAGARDSKCKKPMLKQALHTRAPAATPRWPAPSAGPPSRPRSRRPGRLRRPCCWGLVVCARVSEECRAGEEESVSGAEARPGRASLFPLPRSRPGSPLCRAPRTHPPTPTHIPIPPQCMARKSPAATMSSNQRGVVAEVRVRPDLSHTQSFPQNNRTAAVRSRSSPSKQTQLVLLGASLLGSALLLKWALGQIDPNGVSKGGRAVWACRRGRRSKESESESESAERDSARTQPALPSPPPLFTHTHTHAFLATGQQEGGES